MRNDEITKALRICVSEFSLSGCRKKCPYYRKKDCRSMLMADAADVIARLAPHSDAEANGQLVRLRCPVGSKVRHKEFDHVFTVETVELGHKAGTLYRCGNPGTTDYMAFYDFEIGDTIEVFPCEGTETAQGGAEPTTLKDGEASDNGGSVSLDRIVAKLNAKGRMEFYDGASENEIVQFERNHFVRLPEKYREWLRFSDGGELFLSDGIRLYGVSHAPLIDTDGDLAIGAFPNGDRILCDAAGERISIWDHVTWRDRETFDDFYAFLEALPDIFGVSG